MTVPAETETARRVALFLMGPPRSGTSALTRVLSLCGGALPVALKDADAGNPRGYWEPSAAADLNAAILRRHDSAWFDPSLRLQEQGPFNAKEKAACIAEIGEFLTALPAAPFVVIKEGGTIPLSSLWFEAARVSGFDVAVVITVRHPQESIPSLAKLIPASPELASAFWLKANLLSERNTRGVPRVFVEYANLLDDWRRELKRVSAALSLDLNTRDEGSIDEFLTPDLRHHQYCGQVTEPFGIDWFSATYETLRAAARDDPWDACALDRVFEEYRASERGFRIAFEDFRKHLPRGVAFRVFGRAFAIEARRLA